MKELLKAKAEFRKKGVTLIADKVKSGGGGSWNFAGEDNLVKTIQQPLIDCGLEIISTIKNDSIVVTLWHIDSGQSIESSIIMPPVVPRKDKNGNDMYLDAEIERGKQFGYWSRILTIRVLGLSDIDPEDMNNRPQDVSDETREMKIELHYMIEKSKDVAATKKWICDTYKVLNVEDLNSVSLKHVINLLKQKAKK